LSLAYYQGDEMKRGEIGGEYSTHEIHKTCYKILVGNPEGKRPLGKPRSRWEDNIIIDLKEMSGKIWTRAICFMIVISGGLLRTFGFHKKPGNLLDS